MSYLLPHLRTGWAVDQAILNEEDRVVVVGSAMIMIQSACRWTKPCRRSPTK